MSALIEQQYSKIFNGQLESIYKVVNKLTEINTCPYCILRFFGLYEASFYRHLLRNDLNNWIEDIVKYKLKDNYVCCICLGILQPHFSDDQFITSIYDDVMASGFKFDDFVCAVSLPVCIIVREHALWLFLHKEFETLYKQELPKDNIVLVKDVWKWINAPKFEEKFGVALNQKSLFNIQINFEYSCDYEESKFLLFLNSAAFRKRKSTCKNNDIINRLSVQRALDSCKQDWFQKRYNCPPSIPEGAIICKKITCVRDSLYLAGLYNKYSRTLSQTPWLIGDEKKYEDSVEQIISDPIYKMTQASDMKFSSSGREDVDVRMLGRGRPFLLELINSKKLHFSDQDIQIITDEINKSKKVNVNGLQIIEKRFISLIKEGEEKKIKIYNALCTYKGTITDDQLKQLNNTKEIVLKQKTPLRVLHRRTLAIRERTIHSIHAKKAGEGKLIVEMSTQAGTYIKEFVHGDFGRTVPSLGDILKVECDIIALDVQEILIDWPPKLP